MPKIICADCKAIENVAQAPPPGTRAVCGDCQQARIEQRRGDKKNIPRRKHGTRVMLPITCSECGTKEILDYMPKGAKIEEVLCTPCARKLFGTDSPWARTDAAKRREQERESKTSWEFKCAECGRDDLLPFFPKPGEDFFCKRCHQEQETPSKERLAGREKAGGGVFIRKRDKADS